MVDMCPLLTIFEFTSSYRTVTWLGSFGASSEKPLQLWSTEPYAAMLKRMRPACASISLCKTTTVMSSTGQLRRRYDGNKAALAASAVYPRGFGRAVVNVTLRFARGDKLYSDIDDAVDID
jgi:hypothetical protein